MSRNFGIPTNIVDNDLESKVLDILEGNDVPINPSLVEDSHRFSSKALPRKSLWNKTVVRTLVESCWTKTN